MKASDILEPTYPFALLNEYHVIVPHTLKQHRIMGENALINGKFKKGASVIDVNCQRFPILDVTKKRISFNPLNIVPYVILPNKYDKIILVEYMYDNPIQLSFDEARNEIVDLICLHGWYRQTGGTEKQFRETRGLARNMSEFLTGEYGVGFYGDWVLHMAPSKARTG